MTARLPPPSYGSRGPRVARGLIVLCAGALAACVSPLDRAEALYRQGDVRAALEIWRAVDPNDPGWPRVKSRLEVVEPEFERTLRRYEKRAEFFESEGRLAEAVLYYRLALKMAPDRESLLERVQQIARQLSAQVGHARADLTVALEAGRLLEASEHAATLERLDPFDPGLQIEIRGVRATVGSEVLRHLESGKRLYGGGYRRAARQAFQSVLALEPGNETALGYLSYLGHFSEPRSVVPPPLGDLPPPPPASVSPEEILAEGHYRSAKQAEAAGDPFGAIAEYLAALRVNPGHADARRGVGALRRRLEPRVEELYEVGKRYFQDEDLQNALRVWRQVLLIEPGHGRTRENVDRAERILARLEELQSRGS